MSLSEEICRRERKKVNKEFVSELNYCKMHNGSKTFLKFHANDSALHMLEIYFPLASSASLAYK